ncbi:MAG TPA: sigma-70 family RNA polymerase sigma factor [Bacteroidales bacterium]|nr:sigma-70 family RNA polymerase sigma factor [Bacteroidales bacterium]HPS96300.1 sigma-70 family RNA polymerase sigma factor [Bacteroidales bacterium]
MEKTGSKHIKKISDKSLVEQALQKREEAYSAIVSRYQERVTKYILLLVSNNDDAKDISQETFEKAFGMLHSYDSQYAFSTWLFTIAKNCCIDFLRKQRLNVRSIETMTNSDDPGGRSSSVPSPEENFIFEQEIDKLKRHIEKLPELYREVAELRFLHEYAYEEIAKELNLPLGTIKTRIRRAKEHLIKDGKFNLYILS